MKRTFNFAWADQEDIQVSIQVDTDVLTVDVAHEINNFITAPDSRLIECDGDIYRVVAQMFASYLMRWALSNGGAYCNKDDPRGQVFLNNVLEWLREGWPDADKCGLTIVNCFVFTPDFDQLTAREVTL